MRTASQPTDAYAASDSGSASAEYDGYARNDLTITQIKDMHDKSFVHNQTTRIQAADDRLFAWITHWDSSLLQSSNLSYKGEFDIIRKATRDIASDLDANPVQITFEPRAGSRKPIDDAKLMNGIYLTSDGENTTIEAKENARQETIDCGIGGWERYTEYGSQQNGDKHQVIKCRPLYEFNNNCFPDPNAKLLDKSDAKYWSLLEPYSLDGYQELVKELTGEDKDVNPADFAAPESSYVFPWVTGNELYYVVRFYHKTQVKDKILTFTSPEGDELKFRESDLSRGEVDVMDELIDQGYILDKSQTKKIKRWQVKLYIASGEKILKAYIIPGEEIPVIPMYGERAFIEGEEHYEGVVRLAKDPQRLRDFLLSYLGDMVSRSPREKPIFGAEQIAGFETMYQIPGADNNYPYGLQHLRDAQGRELPLGPVGTIKPPEMSQAMATAIDLTRQAVEDVANPGLPNDIADVDLSGRALDLIQRKLDQQSIIYQKHYKHAQRYDAKVVASMAPVVLDSPRPIKITLPDGTRKTEYVMRQVMDEETGEMVILNDLTNVEFEVHAKLGKQYDSAQEKTREQLEGLAEMVAESDPMLHKALIYKIVDLTNGVNMDDIKDYTQKQLMLMGIKTPETPEEIKFMEEAANTPKEPDSSMVLAQAELLKGQAALLEQQRTAKKDQKDDENTDGKLQVSAYEAETRRMEVTGKLQRLNLDDDLTKAKITGQKIKNMNDIISPFRARANKPS